MATWQYKNETSFEGGTANLGQKTFYVDSFEVLGDVTGNGSATTPYQTIQKVLNVCAANAITEADIVGTGYFQEGDFTNRLVKVSLIAEGSITIKADLQSKFKLCSASNSFCSFNYDIFGGNKKRNYGRITFKDFPLDIYFGIYYYVYQPTEKVGCVNVTFINNPQVGTEVARIDLVEGCIFNMPTTTFAICIGYGSPRPSCFVQKNIFIGGYPFFQNASSTDLVTIRDNYFSPTTLFYSDHLGYCPSYNNHFEGSFVGKINVASTIRADREAMRLVYPNFDNFGQSSLLPSLFNIDLNSSDYTYQAVAPNATGGHDGKQIGVYGASIGAENTDDANWTIDANATKGTGEIYQSGGTTSIVTNANSIQFATVPKRIEGLIIPGSLVDYLNGYTIDTVRSADEIAPNIETIEIKVADTDLLLAAWNALPWIKVPLNGIPYVDGSGVGSGDVAYVHATRSRITGKYIKFRITLRNNEVILP